MAEANIEEKIFDAIDADVHNLLVRTAKETRIEKFVEEWRRSGFVRIHYAAPSGKLITPQLCMHMVYMSCLRPLLLEGVPRAACIFAAFVAFETQQNSPRILIRVTPDIWQRILAIQSDARHDSLLSDAARIISALRHDRAFVFTIAAPQIRKVAPAAAVTAAAAAAAAPTTPRSRPPMLYQRGIPASELGECLDPMQVDADGHITEVMDEYLAVKQAATASAARAFTEADCGETAAQWRGILEKTSHEYGAAMSDIKQRFLRERAKLIEQSASARGVSPGIPSTSPAPDDEELIEEEEGVGDDDDDEGVDD